MLREAHLFQTDHQTVEPSGVNDRNAMKLLFVTSEFADFAKAGGLADVSAALPRALEARGVDVRILMPAYQNVLDKITSLAVVASLPGPGGDRALPHRRDAHRMTASRSTLSWHPRSSSAPGTPYTTPEGYDWPDNDLRFARLGLAAAEIGAGHRRRRLEAGRPPLRTTGRRRLRRATSLGRHRCVPSVFTIHNLAHQGSLRRDRLDASAFRHELSGRTASNSTAISRS